MHPEHPVLHIHGAAVVAATAAGFFFGWLWYGPLFGKTWAKLAGVGDPKPTTKQLARGMALSALGAFLTAYVLAHSVEVWRPTSWNAAWADQPAWTYGFFGGFCTWLGFYVPPLLASVAWEGKSWKLYFLNAAYAFLSLQIVGAILAHWR